MRGKVSTIKLERSWGPVGQGLAKQYGFHPKGNEEL